MAVSACILVYGLDLALLHTRELLFQKSGYQVCATSELAKIEEILSREQVDLLVLCHTLSRAQCDKAEILAARVSCPVLTLLAGDAGCDPGENNQSVEVFKGPEAVLTRIEHLLISRSPSGVDQSPRA